MKVQFSSDNLDEAIDMKDFQLFSFSDIMEEKKWGLSNQFIKASFCDFQSNDFNIFQTSIKSEENCKVITKASDKSCVCIGMPLHGAVSYHYNKIKSRNADNIWYEGFTNIVVSSEIDGYSRFGKKYPLDMIEILISPHYFGRISETYPNLLEKFYKRLCNGESFFLSPENIQATPSQIQVFQDIMQAKVMGNAAKMYIESKIMESISLFISGIDKITEKKKDVISISDKDKMYQVRNIIQTEYQNFPSLHQLAIIIGTNEFKLKSAFKTVFGTTIFGYLFNHRMLLASQFLLDTNLSIQEIALLVGYEHQSHFCNAFKRKFILSPLEYRKKNFHSYINK